MSTVIFMVTVRDMDGQDEDKVADLMAEALRMEGFDAKVELWR